MKVRSLSSVNAPAVVRNGIRVVVSEETVRLVVEATPVFVIWKSVDVANAEVEEPIAKSVGPVYDVEAAKSERSP